MKVVHITYQDTGGAAIAVKRIHESLLEANIDSNLLLLWNNTNSIKNCTAIHDYTNTFNKYKYKAIAYTYSKVLNFLSHKGSLYIRVNYLNSLYRIHNHPLIKEADIIHLHWINRFIDLPSFLAKVKKPIIWTFHDMTPFTGGLSYEGGVDARMHQKFLRNSVRKLESFKCSNLTGVATSNGFLKKAVNYGLFKMQDLVKIPYPISIKTFYDRDKLQARKQLGLPLQKKIVLFVAADINNKRKGLGFILSRLDSYKDNDITFVVVGDGFNKREGFISLGVIMDENKMALAYAAADLFVTPAVEEAFGQTTLESICCGVPVVSFETAGAKELVIDGFNGFIVREADDVVLRETIIKAISFNFDRKAIAQHASTNYNNITIADQYIKLYASKL